MKHKKFVKQLMALGYQRNEAESLAEYARLGGWTYEQYMRACVPALRGGMPIVVCKIFDALTPAMIKLAEAAKQAARNLAAALDSTKWDTPYGRELRRWLEENVPQSKVRHLSDMLAALVYTLDEQSQEPQNPQWQRKYMGRWVGIDVANGPDMTAPAPNQHLDGLNARITLADERADLASDKIHDQAMSACAGGGEV